MFERYTEPARRALFFARYEATQLGSVVISPEHLLLGVIRESAGGTAGRILSDAGLTLEGLREEITRGQPPTRSVPTHVEIPFTSAAKWVLTSAAEEADRLLHADIGPEHLLLGILREEQSAAARVLIGHGLSLSAVRDRIVLLRSADSFAHVSSVPSGMEAGVHIAPSQSIANLSRRSSSGWTIAGAPLRGILAKIHDIPESRVDMPAELDTRTPYDVSLVLGRSESAETMVRQMREGLERKFQIAIALETRATDVYVVTAPSGGIRARKHADEESGGLGAFTSSSAELETAVLETKTGVPRRPPWPIRNLSGVMSIRGLCDMLEHGLGRPVIDETRLAGTYEIDIRTEAGTTEAFLQKLKEQVGLVIETATRNLPTLIVRPRPAA